MGWISKRHMEQGGSIGGKRKGRKYPKEGAPLRKVVAVLRRSTTLFETSWVRLECGHEAESWGGTRARCPGCKPPPKDAEAPSAPEGRE